MKDIFIYSEYAGKQHCSVESHPEFHSFSQGKPARFLQRGARVPWRRARVCLPERSHTWRLGFKSQTPPLQKNMAAPSTHTCPLTERSFRGRVPPLLTDLYHFTMAYAYWRAGRDQEPAVFELFFRENPFGGGFTLFGGLNDCLRFLRSFRFTEDGEEPPRSSSYLHDFVQFTSKCFRISACCATAARAPGRPCQQEFPTRCRTIPPRGNPPSC